MIKAATHRAIRTAASKAAKLIGRPVIVISLLRSDHVGEDVDSHVHVQPTTGWSAPDHLTAIATMAGVALKVIEDKACPCDVCDAQSAVLRQIEGLLERNESANLGPLQ